MYISNTSPGFNKYYLCIVFNIFVCNFIRLVIMIQIYFLELFGTIYLRYILSWKFKRAFLIACRLSSVCPSDCKLFTFSSSSPEPLGHLNQTCMVQSILGWKEFKFVQIKGQVFFQEEIITKKRKHTDEI